MKHNTQLLKLDKVLEIVPVSRSTWLRGVKSGLYPAPVKISTHLNAWRQCEIDALTKSLIYNSIRETSDHYRNVICNIGKKHRVILCKLGIQWITQSCDGNRAGARRWAGTGYVTSRKKLIELCRELEGFSEQNYLPILLELPENMGGRANG